MKGPKMRNRKLPPTKEPWTKREWTDYGKWRLEDEDKKLKRTEDPPCPRCGKDWRALEAEKELPPETLCPDCQRARRK